MSEASEILKKPYRRVIVPEEDGTFRAEIMEFPGCIAIGETADQALVALEEVAESWIEVMLSNKNSIPDPLETTEFSGRTVLRMAKSLHARASHTAKMEGVSLNQFIVGCVTEQLGRRTLSNSSTTTHQIGLGEIVVNISTEGTHWGPSLAKHLVPMESSILGDYHVVGTNQLMGFAHILPHKDWT